ncbi:hypothetical protein KA183_02990 [bacterium]|nr:hypothetical protein [bacterium]
MQYLLNVADSQKSHLIVLSLTESMVNKSAIDVVFDVLGADAETLVKEEILLAGQVGDFKALQKLVFDRDAQGLFIRDGIEFNANGNDLNPDAKMSKSFVVAQKEGMDYKRCELTVSGLVINQTGDRDVSSQSSQHGQMEDLARLVFLHQLAIGSLVDVTKENLDLTDIIKWAEDENLVEIDVDKAVYKLTAKGIRMHDSYIEEAQSLIERFDIFSDVDMDAKNDIHFDTGLGSDLRVPIYELEGIDPYRARFLLGLNDGEWNSLDNWTSQIINEKWYREIFDSIDKSPSLEDIGENIIKNILEQGKAAIRKSRSFD